MNPRDRLFVLVSLSLCALASCAKDSTVGPSTTVTMGNRVAAPNSSDIFLGPNFDAPRTDVDLASPANASGTVTSATFGWSSSSCRGAAKVKFFRRSGEDLVLVAERGPVDITSDLMIVTLSPAVAVRAGDLIAIARVQNCGNPVGLSPGSAAGYVGFRGDVSGTVALANGQTVRNFTLAVAATGTN
jgi:hypothetical protein